MALKVLFADPDPEYSEKIEKLFKERDFEVVTCNSGKETQVSFKDNKFFSAILCIDINNHSGAQVLNFIKMNHPSLKLAITVKENSPYTEDFEDFEKSLLKMGVTAVLKAPFDDADLVKLVEGEQNYAHYHKQLVKREGQSDEVKIDESDDKFTALRIDEFISSQNVLFDIFIQLKPGKYIKVLHAGDAFSDERLNKYQNEKGLTHLYFLTEDRNKYIRFCDHLLKKMFKSDKVSSATKVAMTKNMTEKYVEELYTEGVKPQILEKGKMITDQHYNLIKKENDLYALLRKFQDFDPSAYSHAFLTSLFANMIIKQFQWHSEVTTYTVAMGCLLHDIGKMKLDPTLAGKKAKDMTDAELEEYRKHPELGVELLSEIPTVKSSIKQIVLQHHEYSDSTGFPYQLNSSKIFTLAKIVVLANDFADMMVDMKAPPVEVLKVILKDPKSFRKYNPLIIENFTKVFQNPKKLR